jgi:hypothetical protein
VKENKRFENSKVSNAFNMELIKNCANQFGIKGRNQKEMEREMIGEFESHKILYEKFPPIQTED